MDVDYEDSISDISDINIDNVIPFQETEENRNLREAIEELVSNVALPESSSADANIDEDDLVVLSPDHPMLQGFHKSVALHLEKQKEQIINDIRELSTKVKRKRKDVDDLAEKLYNLQQTSRRQNKQIDANNDNITNDFDIRQELDKQVQELKRKHKTEVDIVVQAQINEEQKWRKLNDLTEKEYTSRIKKEEEESKIAVVKRRTEKAQVDKKSLIEEKKKQDELLYRLTCEEDELKSRNLQLESQLEIKKEEKSRLLQAIKSAADDLTIQNNEYSRLVQSWQRLLINSQNKDKNYAKLCADKESLEEEKKGIVIQIERYKKGGLEEMERNEKLILCVKRLEKDREIFEQKYLKEKVNVEEAENKLDKVDSELNKAEENLQIIKQKHHEKFNQKNMIENEIAILIKQQLSLEQKICESLNEQATQDKTIQFAIKNLEKINKEIDQLEVKAAQKELQMGNLRLDIEKQRFQEVCTSQLIKERNETVERAQADLNYIFLQLQKLQTILITEQNNLDRLNRKLNKILEKTGGKEVSKTKIIIRELEGKLKEMINNIEFLQKKLLRKEIGLLEQTKTRTSLKKEIEDSQKHVEHLHQKSINQKEFLENSEEQSFMLKRKTEEELHVLSNIDKEHSKLKDLKQSLEEENLFAYKDILAAKKQQECAMEKLTVKLDELKNEKTNLHGSLCEHQKLQVDLEAKVTLAVETKKAIDKERGSTGEIAELKSEIHRMEVRLSQLKKTQDRLTLDLEQCVLRRDAMVDSARARNTTKSLSSPTTANLKNLRKLENLRHSNKQFLMKIQKLHTDKSNLIKLEEEIKEIEGKMELKQSDILKIKEPFVTSDSKLSNLQVKKKQNLEKLIHEQQRCKGLNDAKDGKYKPFCRSENTLMSETQRQRVAKTNLLSVIDTLKPDFPLLQNKLSTIAAPLKNIRVVYNILEEELSTVDDQ